MHAHKEKQPNALTSKENLSSPNLVKDPNKRDGRDMFDFEGQEFYGQLEEDRADLAKADIALQVLLRRKIINLDERVSSAVEKINERIKELEETLDALKGRGFARNEEIKRDEIDDDFEKLMDDSSDEMGTELEHLETANRVLGHLLRSQKIAVSDAFIKAVEAIDAQIKAFTP